MGGPGEVSCPHSGDGSRGRSPIPRSWERVLVEWGVLSRILGRGSRDRSPLPRP